MKRILLIGSGKRVKEHEKALNLIQGIETKNFSYHEFKENKKIQDVKKYHIILVCVRWDKNAEIVNLLNKINKDKIIIAEKPLLEKIEAQNRNNIMLAYDRRFYKNTKALKYEIDKSKKKLNVFCKFSDDVDEKVKRFNLTNKADYLHIYFVHIINYLIYLFGTIDKLIILSKDKDIISLLLLTKKAKIELSIFSGSRSYTRMSFFLDKKTFYLNSFEDLKIIHNNLRVSTYTKENRDINLKNMWVKILKNKENFQLTSLNEEYITNKLISRIKKIYEKN
jgi:hypothetical protein